VGKIAKKQSEGVVNSALKIQYHIVKNTLSQTAFPGILLTGMLFYKRGVYDFELTNAL